MNHHLRSAQVWHVFSRNLTVFSCTPTRLIRNRNEPYLPLPVAGTHLPRKKNKKTTTKKTTKKIKNGKNIKTRSE